MTEKETLADIGARLVDAIEAGDTVAIRRLRLQYTELNDALLHRSRIALPLPTNPRLTVREARVVTLAASRLDTKTIADLMGIAPGTVKMHLRNARSKTIFPCEQEVEE